MTTNTQQVALQTYAIDASHSRVGFTVRHLGFSKLRGSFELFEGTIAMQPGDVSSIETEATIEVASVATGDAKRDEHLRSADFFEAETYPHITFKSTGVKNVSGSRFILEGDFTVHGVTKRIELDAEYLGEATDPWGNSKIALEARATINRKDFGLNWNAVLETGGVLVSDTVDLVIEVQAALQQ
jgi:polyisoprenoid-binding protein YceI